MVALHRWGTGRNGVRQGGCEGASFGFCCLTVPNEGGFLADQQLKFGRRPPKNAPALMLGPSLTGVIPPHPTDVDYLARLSNWQMLGNDQYGDCVAVTWANERRLVSAALAGAERYPSQTQVYELYKTQNPAFPAEDNGMDIQTCLEHLASVGGPDGVKAVAFAKVDVTNLAELDAATAIFGCLWAGITVREANMTEFDREQPWDYIAGSPVDGGHSVLTGGYNASQPADDIKFITWGKETAFTDAFIAQDFDEAWVVIWPEHLGSVAFQEGVDLATLAADFTALTGRTFPVPVPPPPAPPTDPDAAFALVLHHWVVERHYGENKTVQKAARIWLAAKGL